MYKNIYRKISLAPSPLSTRTPGPASSGPCMLLLAARGPTARARSKSNGRSCPAATHAQVPGSQRASPRALSTRWVSLALHLSQPFCTLLLGFIGLALSRPGYHPLRRVHWRPASPSAYLARVLRSQPEPARFIFSASGTRCNPLHRPARLQMGSSAHGSHLSRPASSSPRRVHGVIPYTGPLAFKWVHRLTAST